MKTNFTQLVYPVDGKMIYVLRLFLHFPFYVLTIIMISCQSNSGLVLPDSMNISRALVSICIMVMIDPGSTRDRIEITSMFLKLLLVLHVSSSAEFVHEATSSIGLV